jgi:FtsP/CotA-like multicopper oxidase with cupredoxin domain/peroxiredoxin
MHSMRETCHSFWLMTTLTFLFEPAYGFSQPAPESSGTYSQLNRSQSLQRDVSYVSPQEIVSGSATATMDLRVVEVVNRFNDIDLRHRSYNRGLVGPTTRVRAGQVLKVRLQNDLEDEPPDMHDGNIPHGFNTTNLHTHGLHVSPQSPADDVFQEIAPAAHFDFQFQIPKKHPAGTFWYHAHKHGSTALQLAGGMAGALIVQGGLDDIPEIKAAEEKILVLQQFVYQAQNSGPAIIYPNLLYSGTGDIVTAINGVVTPTIVMRPGEVQRWRIIHAGTTEAIFLYAEGVTFQEIAVDGLATGTLVEKTSLQLYPGYRSDILVKAPIVAGPRLVYSLIRDPGKAISKRPLDQQNILRLVIEGTPRDMPLPSLRSLEQVRAFTDQDVPRDDEIVNRRVLRFAETATTFTINGESFDPNNIRHTIKLGTSEEWTLISDGGVHPFRIHVNPFAIKPANSTDPWVWRDTIAITQRQPATIRIRFQDFDGKTVLHCHNLTHEDQGMMQAIRIAVDPPPAPTRTSLKRASTWTARDSSGRQRSSDEFRGKLLMLVLHKGLRCLHCAEQLSTLQRQHETLSLEGIQLVTVSPYVPDDPADVETLNQLPFPILTDPELKCFHNYQCLDKLGEPLHGIFLIDSQNRVLLEHRTETAVSDPLTLVLDTLGKQGD